MKRSNKKGFTIVELVIVIAVIAILAAVLIPTIAGLVKKANLSADQQAVRQMNVALAETLAKDSDGKLDVKEVKNALDSALVNVESGLVPVTQGYAFYWDSNESKVILVATGDEIKDGWQLLTSNNYGTEYTVTDGASVENAIAAAANEPVYLKLTENIGSITIPADTKHPIYIDLNGNAIEGTVSKTEKIVSVESGATLTIANGEINAPANDTAINYSGIVTNGGTLVLDTVVINNTFVEAKYFADLSITGCTINAGNEYYGVTTNSSSGNDGARISITKSEITAHGAYATAVLINIYSNAIIDDCTLNGNIYGLVLRGNNATVKNTKINALGFTGQLDALTSNAFKSGTQGMPSAAVVLNAQTGYDYDSNYTFEGVTINKDSDGKDLASSYDVAVGAFHGYDVTVNGITVDVVYGDNTGVVTVNGETQEQTPAYVAE